MQFTIANNSYFFVDNIDQASNDFLWNKMTFEDPNSRYKNNGGRTWQNKIRKYDYINKRCLLTYLPRMYHICKENNLPCNIVDVRDPWKYSNNVVDISQIDKNFLPGITLEDYQIEAIKTAVKLDYGIIKATTGSGKGEMIVGICKAISCPTIVLADMTVVVSQLKERLELRNVEEEIGLFFSGEKPNGERIVVGSIQSLAPPASVGPAPSDSEFETTKDYEKAMKKWQMRKDAFKTRQKNYRFLIDYVKKAEMLIVDECVDENSFIHTDIGLITASELFDRINDKETIKVECLGGKHLITDCSDKFDDSLSIRTIKSRELITSYNHKFAVFENGNRIDKYASDLKCGDLLLVNNLEYNCANSTDSKENLMWYFAGLFIGDGHMPNYSQIKFGVRKDFDDWIDLLNNMSNNYNGEFTYSFNNRGDLVLRFKSEEIITFIRNLGFSKGRKMGSIDPKFYVPKNHVSDLLRGLFDAEGTAYDSCCHFDSSDKKLSVFVQNCLSYLGIVSNLFVSNHRDNCKHEKSWRVSITSSQYSKFLKLVGFNFKRKIKKFISDERNTNCFIDPSKYVLKWRKYLSLSRLKSIVGFIPKQEISLNRLIEFQNSIESHMKFEPSSFVEAKRQFCISYKKVADYHCLPLMSTYIRINRYGHDYLWIEYVDHIKQYFSANKIDTTISGYAVEPIHEIVNSGKRRLIDFTVDTVSSFNVNGFLVHNCDRSSSTTYKSVIRTHFKGRKKFGFSATPYDISKPIRNLNIEENFGPIIFNMERTDVESRGRIIPCKYRMIVYEDPMYELHNKITLDDATNMFMVENQRFHDMIFGLCNIHKNEKNMILVDRIPLGENLLARASQLGLNARFIYGMTSKSEREETIDLFAAGQLDVLIGGKIVNRGLDIKGGVDNLINATGGKLRSDFLQKIGRALRVNKRGYSYVYDFLFRCNHYLYEHSKARLETIIDAGYESTVMYGYANISGEELVKRNFVSPKKSK